MQGEIEKKKALPEEKENKVQTQENTLKCLQF